MISCEMESIIQLKAVKWVLSAISVQYIFFIDVYFLNCQMIYKWLNRPENWLSTSINFKVNRDTILQCVCMCNCVASIKKWLLHLDMSVCHLRISARYATSIFFLFRFPSLWPQKKKQPCSADLFLSAIFQFWIYI